MNILKRTFCLFFILLLSACGESDLTEEYMADAPKILAVKISDPETVPGENITMRVLVAGKGIDQKMSTPVLWYTGKKNGIVLGASAYNEDFTFPVPGTALQENLNSLDVPVFAQIEINGKALTAQKLLRITHTPVGKNPEISGITLRYVLNDVIFSQSVQSGESITIPEETENISLTVATENLPEKANDQLVYRWYVSTSKSSDGKLYVYDDEKTVEELLGEGAMAAEFRESVVYSLKGEENDKKFQSGTYDIYVIIRDNKLNSQSTEDDRLGTDFIYVTVIL